MKKKLAKIFDTIPEENSSYKAIFASLDARGKIDMRKMIDVVVMIIEEVDEISSRGIPLEAIPVKKPKPKQTTKK